MHVRMIKMDSSNTHFDNSLLALLLISMIFRLDPLTRSSPTTSKICGLLFVYCVNMRSFMKTMKVAQLKCVYTRSCMLHIDLQ